MAKLYTTIITEKGTITSKASNREIVTHNRGWNIGVLVKSYITVDGDVIIEIYKTGGSLEPHSLELLKIIKNEESV